MNTIIFLKNKKFVVVDADGFDYLPDNKPYYDGNGNVRVFGTGNMFSMDAKEIVASSYPLESLPLISNSLEDVINMVEDAEIEKEANEYSELNTIPNSQRGMAWISFVAGRKSSPKKYTEEFVIGMIQFMQTTASTLYPKDMLKLYKQTSIPEAVNCEIEIKEGKCVITKIIL